MKNNKVNLNNPKINERYWTAERLNKILVKALISVKHQYYELCPDKRVVHLAKYGNKKTQKKNFHRAIKIMGKEGV